MSAMTNNERGGCSQGCGVGCLMLLVIMAVLYFAGMLLDGEEYRATTSGSSVQTSEYIPAASNIWTGVKLYYGPAKMYVGEVMGGCGRSFGMGSRCAPPWESERMVLVRFPSGSTEWKSRDAIVKGPWYVRRNDPALGQQVWREY